MNAITLVRDQCREIVVERSGSERERRRLGRHPCEWVAAEEVGGLDSETAQALREAFTIVCKVRLEHHAACIQAGEAPDNLIDPAELPPLERASLREAFLAIARAQKQLGRFVPLGL